MAPVYRFADVRVVQREDGRRHGINDCEIAAEPIERPAIKARSRVEEAGRIEQDEMAAVVVEAEGVAAKAVAGSAVEGMWGRNAGGAVAAP